MLTLWDDIGTSAQALLYRSRNGKMKAWDDKSDNVQLDNVDVALALNTKLAYDAQCWA